MYSAYNRLQFVEKKVKRQIILINNDYPHISVVYTHIARCMQPVGWRLSDHITVAHDVSLDAVVERESTYKHSTVQCQQGELILWLNPVRAESIKG